MKLVYTKLLFFQTYIEMELDKLLDKYWDIIKKEVNVKELDLLPEDMEIKKIYKPVWRDISDKFGKDTWKIIKFAKQGNVEKLNDDQIKVFGDNNEWVVDLDNCEIDYEWIEGDNMAIEKGKVVRLDLEVTDELKKEWVLREMSRFLNQLRKKAEYNVEDRITMYYKTDSDYFANIIENGKDFLKNEALIENIKADKKWGDITSEFEMEGKAVTFSLEE